MNKILVFIQIQNKSSSGSPLENLDSILILRRLRTCYKQKRGRANFLIDRKIKNKLTDKEEELIRTQITHVVNDKPSFENKIDLCILHHGKVKIHFSLEEVSEILGCSVPCLKDHIRNGEFPPPTKDGYSQKLLWKCLSIFLKNPKAESTETMISLKYANGLRNGANSDTHRCKQLTEHGEERCIKLREVAGFSAVRTIFQIVGPRKILHCLLGK